jgi:hypothetical protein
VPAIIDSVLAPGDDVRKAHADLVVAPRAAVDLRRLIAGHPAYDEVGPAVAGLLGPLHAHLRSGPQARSTLFIATGQA